MNKKVSAFFSVFVLMAVLLSACAAPQSTATAPAETVAPVVTEAPAPTAAPTEAPAPTVAPTEAPKPTEAPAATEAPAQPVPGGEDHLVLATTTSTQDSGLLDYLLPMFEDETGIKIDVIAVGTGQALQLGKDGNADVLLVHARSQEDAFMEAGDGTRREDVMYNDFIIVGPEEDPAGIKGMTDATAAFKKIAETESPFISRGDKSGTNTKELAIWKAADIEPAGDWYISAGQGMGEVLTMANEQQAYTLSDRATYLARTKTGLDLIVLVEGDQILLNPYGVIAVNPAKNPNIQAELANKFIDWLISVPTMEKIAEFGKADFGQSLFYPDSALWKAAQSGGAAATEAPASVPADAALKITGKVAQVIGWLESEIKAMNTITVESTNNSGEKSKYSGVLLSDLLKLAQPDSDATTVVFVADGGVTAEASLSDVMACTDCILSFRNKGGFSIVMPNFPANLQVKGVIEFQIK